MTITDRIARFQLGAYNYTGNLVDVPVDRFVDYPAELRRAGIDPQADIPVATKFRVIAKRVPGGYRVLSPQVSEIARALNNRYGVVDSVIVLRDSGRMPELLISRFADIQWRGESAGEAAIEKACSDPEFLDWLHSNVARTQGQPIPSLLRSLCGDRVIAESKARESVRKLRPGLIDTGLAPAVWREFTSGSAEAIGFFQVLEHIWTTANVPDSKRAETIRRFKSVLREGRVNPEKTRAELARALDYVGLPQSMLGPPGDGVQA